MTYHMTVSIEGLEDRIYGRLPEEYGTWEVLQDDSGRMLTREEVLAEIDKCKKLGYEVIPTCDKVDELGHCKGHNFKQVEVYIHGSRDSMYDKGEELGLTGEALRMFSYACSEVKVKLQVDMDTGEAKIVSAK